MRGTRYGARAFTLVELILVLTVIVALTAGSLTVFSSVRDSLDNSQAVTDIQYIDSLITGFRVRNGRFPDDLAEAGFNVNSDPWGNPYVWINLADAPKNPSGKPTIPHRKDKFLNPLNTDYDLFSPGKDGNWSQPLTAGPSRDDIVRAGNGHFVGLAVDY